MADVEFTIGAVDQASRVISMISGNFGTLGNIVASLAGGNYFGALTTAVSATIKVFNQAITLAAEEETSLVRLGATIKSMGLESKLSADGVRGLSEELMKVTNVPHEDLESAAQVFMRMESFDPSNLEQMLKITSDFAAGTGQNAATAAQSIATALETGQTRSLRFSAALRTQVQEMVKAGDSGDALALVMDTLNSKYGGQAAAQMETYSGHVKRLNNAWEEFLANIGTGTLPGGKTYLDTLTGFLDKAADPRTNNVWNTLFHPNPEIDNLLNRLTGVYDKYFAMENRPDKGERDFIGSLNDIADATNKATKSLGGWKDALGATKVELGGYAKNLLEAYMTQNETFSMEMVGKIAGVERAIGMLTQAEYDAILKGVWLKTTLENLPAQVSTDVLVNIFAAYQTGANPNYPSTLRPQNTVPSATNPNFTQPPNTTPRMANGGWFMVPPGYPNDTYPIRVSSGEKVVVTPPGQKGGAGNIIINVNGYTGDIKQLAREVIWQQRLEGLLQ